MRFLSVLYKLEEIEEGMAKFYKSLCEKFNSNLKASTLFYTMYIEEKNHLNLIRYQKKIVWQNQNLFKDIEVNIEKIEIIVKKVKDALSSLNTMDLKESLNKALELEKEVAEGHLVKWTRDSNLKFAFFISELIKDDLKHYGKLDSYLKQLTEKDYFEEITENILREMVSKKNL